MKWFGQIGYYESVKDPDDPFTTKNVITEKDYYGEIIKNYKKDQSSQYINDNFTINNQVRILADPFILGNFHHMRYVTFMGSKWKIRSAEVQYPAILLEIGELYSEEEEDTDD